jgi:serine protease Do
MRSIRNSFTRLLFAPRAGKLRAMKAILLSVALALGANGAHSATMPPWKEILGPPQGKVPGPASFTVTWRTNLAAAMIEARQKNRPLFVTFRCLPCKQCADFDKEVLEGGPFLDPVLTQFITVRITDAAAIDVGIFPLEGFVDLDLSWWGWFLSPEGRVYGVFGGRDHVSDTTRNLHTGAHRVVASGARASLRPASRAVGHRWPCA